MARASVCCSLAAAFGMDSSWWQRPCCLRPSAPARRIISRMVTCYGLMASRLASFQGAKLSVDHFFQAALLMRTLQLEPMDSTHTCKPVLSMQICNTLFMYVLVIPSLDIVMVRNGCPGKSDDASSDSSETLAPQGGLDELCKRLLQAKL